jgi:hypothetical protein
MLKHVAKKSTFVEHEEHMCNVPIMFPARKHVTMDQVFAIGPTEVLHHDHPYLYRSDDIPLDLYLNCDSLFTTAA